MSKPDEYGLILTYNDGSHDQFRFPPQIDKTKMISVLEKLLCSAVISLQLEDRLMVIPTSNIRSAELFPVPELLPERVLRNVRRIHTAR